MVVSFITIITLVVGSGNRPIATESPSRVRCHDSIYQGFADGNPDLFVYSRESVPAVGIQPGVGDSFDLYHGLADGNSELFSPVQDDRNHGPRPDIYGNFGPTRDLNY